jgi:hypothetical protein
MVYLMQCGKSSLINIIAGNVGPGTEVGGSVTFNGSVPTAPLWERCGFVPMHNDHIRDLSVREVGLIGLYVHTHTHTYIHIHTYTYTTPFPYTNMLYPLYFVSLYPIILLPLYPPFYYYYYYNYYYNYNYT